MPAKSISFHVGGGMAYRAHNARYYKPGQSPPHVDDARRGDNEIWVDIDHRRAYKELFSEAVAAYNDRQKRADRKISDYYRQVVEDKTRHPVYEIIIQIGDMHDTGVHDCEAEREVLKEYIEGWAERNPQMMLVGAYLHLDEKTQHLHANFIPWADGYKRGPEKQASISRCCEQMGFEKGTHINETSQAAWTASERLVLEELAQAHGIEIKHIRDGRLHEADKELFIAERKVQELNHSIDELHQEQISLAFDTWKMQAALKGQGMVQLPESELSALRDADLKAHELRQRYNSLVDEWNELTSLIRDDPDLLQAYGDALERKNSQEEVWVDDMEI